MPGEKRPWHRPLLEPHQLACNQSRYYFAGDGSDLCRSIGRVGGVISRVI